MKRRKKIIIITIIVIISLITCCVLYYLWIFGFMYSKTKEAKERQTILLYKTDHEDLLDACRKVLDESRDGKWEKGKIYSIRIEPDPNATKFPKAILDLKPSYVFIDRYNRLIVEMLGGMGHFGVIAYPKDLKGPLKGWDHDKKLIEGLWYYDDGYRETPDYENIIESLRPKGK